MPDKWAASSNTALSISLIPSAEAQSSIPVTSFHPSFSYPIFGEEEVIFGYSDLKISLYFSAASLKPALSVNYSEKNERTTAKVDDVKSTLLQFLPEPDVVTFDDQVGESGAKKDLSEESTAFTPPGQKVKTYLRPRDSSKGKGKGSSSSSRALAGDIQLGEDDDNARVFEVYHSDWNTPRFQQLHRRMQIFSLFFIEGASYIDEGELNWEFYTTYERVKKKDDQFEYRFLGYTSLYNFWSYPSNARVRLSQFVILPPFQKAGHGSELYETILNAILARESVSELTVEDPSEAFDRLRDSSDLKRLLSKEDGFLLRARDAKKGGALLAPIDKVWSEHERIRHKIAPRQWSRLVEMCQLMMLDEEAVDQCKAFRLQVKARLFRFNRDILKQLPPQEKVSKLQETYESVLDEYSELTGVDVDGIIEAGLDQEGAPNGSTNGYGTTGEGSSSKRVRLA